MSGVPQKMESDRQNELCLFFFHQLIYFWRNLRGGGIEGPPFNGKEKCDAAGGVMQELDQRLFLDELHMFCKTTKNNKTNLDLPETKCHFCPLDLWTKTNREKAECQSARLIASKPNLLFCV